MPKYDTIAQATLHHIFLKYVLSFCIVTASESLSHSRRNIIQAFARFKHRLFAIPKNEFGRPKTIKGE